ncbi:MAG: T9SS type A sorting domain-containing protein, partial [candidate division Zixibacteria bacterium]|nr:T9SS type A sorting domain-containing protein [candidate division Zixibacteria bacterium]
EEGGSNPSNGYYRYYVGGWGLLAEMIYRDVYGSDTFRVYADSVADYMVNHYLTLGTTNIMCYAWALGCLYQYGLDVGNQDYITYADTMSAAIKDWIEVAPSVRLNREVWAMSGGALVWGLANSYFQAHPENYYQWMLDNGQYLDVIDTLGDWHIAHNAWYAIGHWTVFKATGDSTYYYNHAFLTDTLLVQDTDEDGGIPAEFTDTADMDQSWCTAYLGFMCLNPLISEMTGIGDDNRVVPDNYVLVRNYPNPFNSSTKIEYRGFPEGKLHADVYDIMGRRVDRIYDSYSSGSGFIDWDAGGIASGIYFVRLHGLGVSGITRAVLVK